MTPASGLILVAPGNRVLLIKRSDTGEWAYTGGHTELGEDPLQGALREAREEVGYDASRDPIQPWGVRITGECEFTAFLARVPEIFEPKLNGEHTEFIWASLGDLPQPLHPGVTEDLAKIEMDETQLAEAIRDGRLPSPQRIGNVHLFALRVTGTGVAYRDKLDEYAYRDPKLYLNDEFLKRCNGLPVIWEHPPNQALNSEEFSKRVIGTVALPYILGDEVWCVARIYDAETAEAMSSEQLSTSPAVAWSDPTDNERVQTEDGRVMLIEGKPTLLDHLAICAVGVWDKGGPATGVLSEPATIGDSTMTDTVEETTADGSTTPTTTADDSGHKLDKLLSALDSVCEKMQSLHSRMDALEAAGKTAQRDDHYVSEEAKQAALQGVEGTAVEGQDAELDPKPTDPVPSAADQQTRMDSRLESRLAALESRGSRDLTDEEYAALAEFQSRADSVARAYGEQAPRPMTGESLLGYRRRVVSRYQSKSNKWKGVNLKTVTDPSLFGLLENEVIADALAAANSAADLPPHQLREVRSSTAGGHTVVEFKGRTGAWMNRNVAGQRARLNVNVGK